jgi:hypothetical protein
MIKSHGENQGHYKQQHQHALVIRTHNQQEKEADDEDKELRRDDIREDRPDKKPVLTLEQRETVWAVMPDVKRLCDDSGFATGGAT